jgi:predicted transcriptional regulator
MFDYETMPKFQALAIMEALMNPRHLNHQAALEQLHELREEVQLERIKAGQASVQHARDNMSDAEWSAWVD